MLLLLLLISASILFIPAVALAQEQDYQVVKSDKSESFVFPYTGKRGRVKSGPSRFPSAHRWLENELQSQLDGAGAARTKNGIEGSIVRRSATTAEGASL